jgi:hypothetical protein
MLIFQRCGKESILVSREGSAKDNVTLRMARERRKGIPQSKAVQSCHIKFLNLTDRNLAWGCYLPNITC